MEPTLPPQKSFAELTIVAKERKRCEALKVRAIPTFGKLPDKVMQAVTIMKPTDKSALDSLSSKVKAAVQDFAKAYPCGEVDLFVINFCAEAFKEEFTVNTQIDCIIHPYVLANCKEGQEKTAQIYASLYRLDEMDPIYAVPGGVQIDAENLLEKTCLKAVEIRNKEGLGEMKGEGMSFIVSTHNPVISFFMLSVQPINESRATLLISL